MRVSPEAGRWIAARATPQDVATIRDLADSQDASVREVMQAILEVLEPEGFRETLDAMAPAFDAVEDPGRSAEMMADLRTELPAVVEVVSAFHYLQLPETVRCFIRAYNSGREQLETHLLGQLTAAMISGMLLERARGREHARA